MPLRVFPEMTSKITNMPVILITGGTSGLGLELVRLFLQKDYIVLATGRNTVAFNGFENRFRFFNVDFSSMQDTAKAAREICKSYTPDIIINNAGILSPPEYMETGDGNEYTFQVNFLAHFLLNEIIIGNNNGKYNLRIAAITSMAYRIGDRGLEIIDDPGKYRPWKAYSDSKLFLAMMCKQLKEKHPEKDLQFIGFDPGVFRSGIYRMQGSWFRSMYRIGAPFMRNPAKVARRLAELIETGEALNGNIYDFRKRIRQMPVIEPEVNDLFWKQCYDKIRDFLLTTVPIADGNTENKEDTASTDS